MTRGSAAVDTMVPNAELSNTPFGWAKAGVFVRLKNSPLNSRSMDSRSRVCLINAMSASQYEGPSTGLREELPSVNWGAT
jgi:hypothetical protein